MELTIWLNEEKIQVLCVGYFKVERSGYYAGRATVENFKVIYNNEIITDQIESDELEELKERYVQHCWREIA